MIIQARSYAKINLGLKILGRRPDGYHDIWSVFQTISLHDDITFMSRRDRNLVLHCPDPAVPTDDRNLIIKAAKLLRQQIVSAGYKTANPLGATIMLDKKIPMGAGLGGGSSNAATTLMALSKLWLVKNFKRNNLMVLANKLGSDVPFFLHGGTCLVTGRGERVHKLRPLFKLFLVIIFPGINISTAWAYSQLSLSLTKRSKYCKINMPDEISWDHPCDIIRLMVNDFEPLVFSHFPEVAKAKRDLQSWGAIKSLLSGSGSAVFGIFPDTASARQAWQGLRRSWPRLYIATNIKANISFKTTR